MTGRLWPFPDRDGETAPATRLLRKGILIPDLMVAFEINVPRGHVASWRGWALPGKSKARARWRGYGVLARDEDAKGQWRHTEVTLATHGFPSSKTCAGP